MRAALITLMVFISVATASAKDRTYVLYDATGDPAWGVVSLAQQFTDAGRPARVITAKAQSCNKAKKHAPDRAIVICERLMDVGAWTHWGSPPVVYLSPDYPRLTRVTCHELMHAIGRIPDDYSRPYPDTSCVWGDLPYLGSFDREWLATH